MKYSLFIVLVESKRDFFFSGYGLMLEMFSKLNGLQWLLEPLLNLFATGVKR
jgi:hypothetical protein